MNPNELFHVLALLKVDGVGDVVAKKLINHCGSAEEVFKSKSQQLQSIDGIGDVLQFQHEKKTSLQKLPLLVFSMDRMAENEKLQMQQNAQKYKTNVVYQKKWKKSTREVRFSRFSFSLREIGKYRLCTPEKCTHRIETRTVPERGRRT